MIIDTNTRSWFLLTSRLAFWGLGSPQHGSDGRRAYARAARYEWPGARYGSGDRYDSGGWASASGRDHGPWPGGGHGAGRHRRVHVEFGVCADSGGRHRATGPDAPERHARAP